MSNPKKKRPTAGARRGKGHLRPTQEKRDDDIIHTNDSSIVSKRSVSKLYLSNEPDFYEPFVQKFVRRNPLINRGYWLRMHAIEQVVLRFLNENNQTPKIVVNLGCGYDPLPFQFWHRYGSSCQNATFVDVDYPQLIEKKRDRMLKEALLRDALLKTNLRSAALPIHLRSDKYMALACDLRDLNTLESVLRAEFDVSSTSILFVAEVSVTYMPLADANALICWAGKFDDSQFCLLEQYLPQGPDHPFAHTMLKHFNKLQTPIYAVKDCPSLELQKSRFTKTGWPSCTVRNLWDLWSDDEFTPASLRRALDAVEPFDEWEEFALFAGHYFLLVASSARCQTEPNADTDADAEVVPPKGATGRHTLSITTRVPTTDTPITPRRFGAACALTASTMVVHGGQGERHRLTSMDVLERDSPTTILQPLVTPQARICHTITTLNETNALLVGGRTSPSHALSDCWYLKDGVWTEAEPLHPGRFRHSSVRVAIPHPESEATSGVLVFGGKTSDGCVLDECTLWAPNHGWRKIPIIGKRPAARFGAAIYSLGQDNTGGLLLGGMSSDGVVLNDVWEYSISAAPELRIQFQDRTEDVHASPMNIPYARFGATLAPFGDSLLLVGGIASKEILSLSDEFVVITAGAKILLETPTLQSDNASWPLLVGAGVAAVSADEVLIAGGGAVCFSMGSFWNSGYVSVAKGGKPDAQAWSVSILEGSALPQSGRNPSDNASANLKSPGKVNPKRNSKGRDTAKQKVYTVPRMRVQSAEDFSRLVQESKPAILEQLDLGPCTELWTLDYLKEKLGADREIVIHECTSDRMTFKDKNFQYVKKSIGEFLDGIAGGSQTYLRAVSATQPNKLPTKLEEDFPAIAADFQLPEVLDSIKETYHSSPLRISGPVSLWLHYDVLANVLCQIKGSKTMRLYPPSDVKYLDYPPGGSSSNTNVLVSKEAKLRHTHPHVASLKPGDVLFIPPMWSHTATPEEGYSVAVNVFFRNLEKGYAAGKDVYGNRDLQAYENGRRDIEKILRAFKDIPDDVSKFYLDRLAAELQARADERR